MWLETVGYKSSNLHCFYYLRTGRKCTSCLARLCAETLLLIQFPFSDIFTRLRWCWNLAVIALSVGDWSIRCILSCLWLEILVACYTNQLLFFLCCFSIHYSSRNCSCLSWAGPAGTDHILNWFKLPKTQWARNSIKIHSLHLERLSRVAVGAKTSEAEE